MSASTLRGCHFGGYLAVLILLCLSIVPYSAHAQLDEGMEEMLKSANLKGKGADNTPIANTNVSAVNRLVHWRLWKRVVTTGGGAGDDELTALESDGRSVGYVNQITYAMAVANIAGTMGDAETGNAMFQQAQRLAPDLPYVYFAHAKYAFDRDPAAFHQWGAAWSRGMQLALAWPDTRFPWALKLLLFLLFAASIAALVFAFGQIIRQFGIVAYDAAAALPKGFSSNQTVILLLAAAIVPGLIYQSPLFGLVVLLALVAIPQQIRERLVSIVVFGLLAALPMLDRVADDLASYSGSQTQALVHAQYIHCGEACLEDLKARLEHDPKDQYIQFTVMLAEYRTSKPEALKRVISIANEIEWRPEIKPYVLNLAGTSELALANPGKAVEYFRQAQPGMPKSGAPAFNLMRAYQLQDDVDKAAAALRESTSRNLQQITQYLRYERRDVNSFVIAEPLPLETFWHYHRGMEREHRSTVLPIWKALAGPKVPLDWSMYFGLAGLIVVFLTFPISFAGKTSTPCPRCGMARDPRDKGKTGNHMFCLPCYRTFVTGAGLDYHARVHNEHVLGRRERIGEVLRRMVSVLLPGGGHHLAGRSIIGFLVTLMLMLGVMMVTRPMGYIRPIHELYSDNWGGTVTIGWILLSIAVLIAFIAAARDIAPIKARGVK